MKTYILFITIASVFVSCHADLNLRELDISSKVLDFGIIEINKMLLKPSKFTTTRRNLLRFSSSFTTTLRMILS